MLEIVFACWSYAGDMLEMFLQKNDSRTDPEHSYNSVPRDVIIGVCVNRNTSFNCVLCKPPGTGVDLCYMC